MRALARLKWWLPAFHLVLFTVFVTVSLASSRTLLEGPAGVGLSLLFLADLPLSIFGFSKMWDGRLYQGLALWAVGGSVMWFVWGLLVVMCGSVFGRTASTDVDDRSKSWVIGN